MSEHGFRVNPDVRLFGGPYAYSRDELVVARQHLQLVRGELPEGSVGQVRTSDSLDLALVELQDVGAAAEFLLAQVGDRVPDPGPPPGQPLEQVLWSLRSLLGHRYAGWTPSIGKNRYLGQVHGVGEVNHGGGGDPQPCDPPLAPRGSRATGPGQGVRVGVLDTGFYPQPWLAGGWSARFSDTMGEEPAPLYSDGHATFVTGLVLEQAPGATVDVRRVLQSTGDPATNGQADSWSVAEAIVDFGQSGLDVLNLSFVCYTEDGQPPLVLSRAIDRLPPELVVVAAAGNHGEADGGPEGGSRTGGPPGQSVKPGWPAALDDVIAVGAVTDEDELAPFCPDARWIDVLARGQDVVSTYLPSARKGPGEEPESFDGYARWSGTSFAAALVSGAIAASTDPGRTSARSAMLDIFAALDRSPAGTVAETGAKVLKLRAL